MLASLYSETWIYAHCSWCYEGVARELFCWIVYYLHIFIKTTAKVMERYKCIF